MKNPLMDKDFLYELNQYKHKDVYARIISLSFDERPLETIEGRVTSGSINIDGNSAVRRTCNLGLIAKDVIITDFYWGISNKFILEIGINNKINSDYPDIIWFKQGIFVISSFNSTWANNNYSISISGKDKMCLLNGDISGNLPASIDFGVIGTYNKVYDKIEIEDYTTFKANKYYYYDMNDFEYKLADRYNKDEVYYTQTQVLEQEKLTIKDIIREAVHVYGKEQYQNIIVNDLDDYGLELLQYRGNVNLFLLYNENASIYDQMLIDEEYEVYQTETSKEPVKLKTLFESNFTFNSGINNFNTNATVIYLDTDVGRVPYTITKIEPNDNAVGYKITDLIYTGDLISSIGESLTSILDKIKNMLGAFEYFYNIDGKFIFQAKKIYTNISWNSLATIDGNAFARDAVEESPYSYSFENVNLISQFNNTPAINSIRNDYSVWGTRKGASGAEIPIHARYAIHEKPVYYKTFKRKKDKQELQFVYTVDKSLCAVADIDRCFEVDWREIIYQMAVDYYKHNQDVDFLHQLSVNNYKPNTVESYYPNGETGYELFYIDMQGFWRQLYNSEPEVNYKTTGGRYSEYKFYEFLIEEDTVIDNEIKYYTPDDNNDNVFTETIIDDSTAKKYYVIDSTKASTELYRVGYIWESLKQTEEFDCEYYLKPTTGQPNDNNYSSTNYYWHKNVVLAPELLNFWIDFYDGDDSLQQYQIKFIGDRPKVVNNSKITSVYYKQIPQIIFMDFNSQEDTTRRKTGYTYVNLPDSMRDLFSISSRGKSAEEEANELFNQHSYCTESITVTSIPIYHLEPNTLIHIRNDENLLNGKYQITRLSIPLSYNGMMSISATKIVDAVY